MDQRYKYSIRENKQTYKNRKGREFYWRHRDELLEEAKEHRKEHVEQFREYKKDYYERNREQMIKHMIAYNKRVKGRKPITIKTEGGLSLDIMN